MIFHLIEPEWKTQNQIFRVVTENGEEKTQQKFLIRALYSCIISALFLWIQDLQETEEGDRLHTRRDLKYFEAKEIGQTRGPKYRHM